MLKFPKFLLISISSTSFSSLSSPSFLIFSCFISFSILGISFCVPVSFVCMFLPLSRSSIVKFFFKMLLYKLIFSNGDNDLLFITLVIAWSSSERAETSSGTLPAGTNIIFCANFIMILYF